ncbi:MAG: UDP-3-O-acyl-N-acetylglucosamine deacetylase [Pseudomonadota bacterium]
MQTTLVSNIVFDGVGLHSGKPVSLTVRPAQAHSGIVFDRVDRPDDTPIPARFDLVEDTMLCTKLGLGSSAVGTIEHIMAALAGCGVHNAYIELDGPEVPILDGSSAPFIKGILDAGITTLDAPLRALKIKKTVRFQDGEAFAEFSPADVLRISFTIDFDAPVIGKQSKSLSMANGAFVRELCDSRTFCNKTEVDWLKANGLGLGGGLHNAVVIDGNEVLNKSGFRHSDECVRHKMLDALGDMALAGGPVIGHYTGHRAGHRITNMLLRTLFASEGAYEWVECTEEQAFLLPGSDLKESDLALIA